MKSFQLQDFPIGRASPEEERKVVAWTMARYESWRSWWSSRIEEGKRLQEATAGWNIFSQEDLAKMQKEHKVPIQLPMLWPKFQAMLGMAMLGKKTPEMIPVGSEDSVDVFTADVILSNETRKSGLSEAEEKNIREGIITGFPQVVFFDKSEDGSRKRVDVVKASWASVIMDPMWRETDLSDCQGIFWSKPVTKEMAMLRYPDRKKEIEQGFLGTENDFSEDMGFTSADRSTFFTAMRVADAEYQKTGRLQLVEFRSMVRMTVSVWYSPEEDCVEQRPTEWDDQRWQEWLQEHPSYQEVKRPTKILWLTTFLANGTLLENRPHWFQTGEWDCSVYVPQWHDELPVGVLEFASANSYMAALVQTERVHSLRLANDQLTITTAGAFKNEKDLPTEISRPGGRLIKDRNIPMAEAIQFPPNRPMQNGWGELFAEAQMLNDQLTVSPNVEGGTQSSQESAKAFTARVQQSTTKAAPYLTSWQQHTMKNRQIFWSMLQQTMTEYEVVRYFKEDAPNKTIEVEVNKPTDFDLIGQATRIMNRLDASEFDFVEALGDNSVTGRANELDAFAQVMQQVMPAVPPENWVTVLKEIPNAICQKIAVAVKQAAEAAAQNPTPPPTKVSWTGDVSKLGFDPVAQQIARLTGVLPEQPQPPAAQGQPQTPVQPEPIGAPA